jgi:hypothetical protein
MLAPLLLAPLLMSLCAAAARASTGLSLETALCIAAPACGMLLVLACKKWGTSALPSQRILCTAIGIALLCLLPFFVAPSYGFVNIGTADGGNHVRLYQSFISSAPNTYHGFVGFYALIFLFQRTLGVFPELALLIALGYTIFALTWMITLWGLTKRARVMYVIALNLFSIVPTVLFLQTNGFYPQIYGLSILILYLILSDRPLAPKTIIPLSLLGAGLLRYSYGLTIADIFLAGSAYLLLRRKVLPSLFLLALGVYAATRLLPIITIPGEFTPIHTASLIVATILLLLGTKERQSLPIMLVSSSLAVWLTLGVTVGFEHYYVEKYPMGLCLVLGAIALQGFASAHLTQRALLAGSLLFLSAAIFPYTSNVADIARGRFVNPEVDLKLIQEIRGFLSSNNRPFRVFLGSKWPRTNMVNAIFNREYGYQEFQSGALPSQHGCVFFDATDGIVRRLKKDRMPDLSRAIDTLLQAPHTRITYDAPWSEGGILTIGIVCDPEP